MDKRKLTDTFKLEGTQVIVKLPDDAPSNQQSAGEAALATNALSVLGETTQIMSIPRSDDVVFDWCGDYLIVRYRDTCTSTGIRPEYEVKAIEIQS